MTEPALTLEEAATRYGNTIFRYCLSILCDWHDAQDAMQDTFVKAHKHGALQSPEAYVAWLYKIAFRTCLNIQRGKRRRFLFLRAREEADKREAAHASYEMHDPFPDPALLAALMSLSPAERALFYSRAVEGMDYAELQERFGIRAATLRKRYERAKLKLKAQLEQSSI